MHVIARIDKATGAIKHVSAAGPFTAAPATDERDVEIDEGTRPTGADWSWCAVDMTGLVATHPDLMPPPIADGVKFHGRLLSCFASIDRAVDAQDALGAIGVAFEKGVDATPISDALLAVVRAQWRRIVAKNVLSGAEVKAVEALALACGFSLT